MKKKVLKIIFVAVILLFLVIQLYPVVWLFMASLKSSAELGSQPFALPKALVFSNYAEIFKDGKILRYMWNSVKVTAGSIILIVVLSSTTGYAHAKYQFSVKKNIDSVLTF